MEAIIGLVELGSEQIPVILGSPVQALVKDIEFVLALHVRNPCNMVNVYEFYLGVIQQHIVSTSLVSKTGIGNSLNIIGLQDRYWEFMLFS